MWIAFLEGGRDGRSDKEVRIEPESGVAAPTRVSDAKGRLYADPPTPAEAVVGCLGGTVRWACVVHERSPLVTGRAESANQRRCEVAIGRGLREGVRAGLRLALVEWT